MAAHLSPILNSLRLCDDSRDKLWMWTFSLPSLWSFDPHNHKILIIGKIYSLKITNFQPNITPHACFEQLFSPNTAPLWSHCGFPVPAFLTSKSLVPISILQFNFIDSLLYWTLLEAGQCWRDPLQCMQKQYCSGSAPTQCTADGIFLAGTIC